jgi:hypothetical protein
MILFAGPLIMTIIPQNFILFCVTNQESREIFIENHTQIADQGSRDQVSSQEEAEESENIEGTQEEEIPIRRSSRQTQPSTRLKDFVMYSV